MRRKKLQLLRDAANLQNFEEASERAAQRERGEYVDDSKSEDSGPAWIDDRRPMYQIKGVGLAVVQASNASSSSSSVVSNLPPGAGSLGMVEAEAEAILDQLFASSEGETSKGKKRKRDEESASTADHAPPRRPGPQLEDMQFGQAPYGGDVPAGISIRHIDCQTYYDNEVTRMEEAAESQASSSLGGTSGQAVEQDARQRGRKKGASKHSQHDHGEEEDADWFYLDYGSPNPASLGQSNGGGSRKKIKIERSTDRGSADSLNREGDRPSSSECGCAGGWVDPECMQHDADVYWNPTPSLHDTSDTWKRLMRGVPPCAIGLMQKFSATEVLWSDLKTSMGLLWKGVALDPEQMVPALMYFVGVVESVESVNDGEEPGRIVKVHAMGPLEGDTQKIWADYEIQKISWTEQDHPSQFWHIY